MSKDSWNILMVVLSTVAPDVRVEKEARYLVNEGHKVTIIATNPSGDLPEEEERDGYLITRIPIRRKLFFKYFEFWKKARRIVGKKKYDIIHLHDLNILPLASKLADNCKILIYDSHENFPEQMSETFGFSALWIYTLLEKYYIKKVHGIITAAATVTDTLKRKYNQESIWVSNYPSKIDVDKAHQKEIIQEFIKSDKFRVVHFGVMYSNLGYTQTVEAVNILKTMIDSSKIEFLIIGSGPALEPMKEMIENKNLNEYFRVTGWMDYLDALSILRTCDLGLILLQPGKNNFLRMPNRLYDYCSSGVPFLGSDFEGLKLATKEAENIGLLIDATSPEEIANSIFTLYSNETDLKGMKSAAKQSYIEKFNWEAETTKIVQKYLESFQKV
ncbi:MAG: glycosyltransferase family 4 protein [Candidatus Heimdallarchaeota archaeon]|nr:glycosyltransferase family 4 protein [Candidatus Heimdallarchaeota archaeon]MCK4955152.1 glycosyltransferase family 4 protein [Candidatus Heimdallarchaeota archaeon]